MSNAATQTSPLSPVIMAKANVSLEDATWLHSQRATPKFFESLQTERGTRILNKVRAFLHQPAPANLLH